MKKRVMIGMSGGVDSSVAAYLLKEQGYDVIGVTMKLWQDDDDELIENEGGCCSLAAVEDARRVADRIGIPFYVLNFSDVFKQKVIEPFIDEYLNGRTPNPCIACNKHIKFDDFFNKARQIGCDYVATGHYAKIEKVRKQYIRDLSVGIANLVNIFEPEAIGIGGSFVYFSEVLLQDVKKTILKEDMLFNPRKEINIQTAVLGNEAGIIGATL